MTDTEQEPLIQAAGLGLKTGRGWVYHDVDLRLPPNSVTALTGPAGSGRSMLLLTIAGRAKPTTGRLTVGGEQARTKIRHLVAVARITAAVELEPELHVIDHIREAELLTKTSDYRTAARTLDLDLDPTALVADLNPDEAVLLAVALAMTNHPRAIVVDDVDIAATPPQQQRIWTALSKTGTAVIASTVDGTQAQQAGATVVRTTNEENSTDASA